MLEKATPPAPTAVQTVAPPRPEIGRLARVGSRAGRIAAPLAFGVVVILLWHMAVVLGLVQEFLVPRPSSVLADFWAHLVSIATGGSTLRHVLTTFQEVIYGLSLALIFGIIIGTAVSEVGFVRRVMMPYIVAFEATPRIAVVPLIIVYFGFGIASKVVVACLTALFPIIVGTIAGLRAAGRNELRLMKALGASPWETLIKVRAKVALPFLFAGIETAVVLAVIGAVVGEFLGGSAGLGYLIVVANESLDISKMFATILLLSLFGLLMYAISVVVRRRVVFWVSDDRFSTH